MNWPRALARLPGPAVGALAAGALAVGVFAGGVLTGCSSGPPANTAQGRCEQQVDQDPAVKALLSEEPLRSGEPIWQEQLAQARRKSVDACLVAAGDAPRGGVQPVSSARYGFGWY